jgi:hypothetical protein
LSKEHLLYTESKMKKLRGINGPYNMGSQDNLNNRIDKKLIEGPQHRQMPEIIMSPYELDSPTLNNTNIYQEKNVRFLDDPFVNNNNNSNVYVQDTRNIGQDRDQEQIANINQMLDDEDMVEYSNIDPSTSDLRGLKEAIGSFAKRPIQKQRNPNAPNGLEMDILPDLGNNSKRYVHPNESSYRLPSIKRPSGGQESSYRVTRGGNNNQESSYRLPSMHYNYEAPPSGSFRSPNHSNINASVGPTITTTNNNTNNIENIYSQVVVNNRASARGRDTAVHSTSFRTKDSYRNRDSYRRQEASFKRDLDSHLSARINPNTLLNQLDQLNNDDDEDDQPVYMNTPYTGTIVESANSPTHSPKL